MNFSFYIAKLYLFTKSSNNAINFISIIAAIGVIIGSAALFIVLSGFAGLKDFSLQFSTIVDPDLKVMAAKGKSFEITPEGVKRESEVNRIESITGETSRKLDFVIIGLLIIGMGYFIYESRFQSLQDSDNTDQTKHSNSSRKTVAVLPFASFSEDKEVGFYRPYNIQKDYFSSSGYSAVCVPAVTAALAMCRKSDFIEVGGFCEEYVYGFEDVDLCLAFNRDLSKQSVVLPDNTTIHMESVSQNKNSPLEVRARRKANIDILLKRFGCPLNRCIGSQRLSLNSLWNSKNVTIGFVVTESGANTVVGDYFTAKELGHQLRRKLRCDIRYLPLRGAGSEHVYDTSCIDILFVMIDRYDIRQIYKLGIFV